MWWSCGHPMWGPWFIFPIMRFIFMIFMIVMIFVMTRLFTGRGGMCGFGRRDEVEDLRKQVTELKSEIETLRRAN